MIIKLSPIRADETLSLKKVGDSLYVNGECFDFSPLPNGASLPACAINSKWFVDHVCRKDGRLHVKLFFPHGKHAPEEARFPKPIYLTVDGVVSLPPYSADPDEVN